MKRFDFCKELMMQAKDYILSHPNFSVDIKSSNSDLVTNVDKGVEQLVRNSIQEFYPMDTIVGEEQGFTFSESMWIVDPIDGTSNFVTKHKDFAISIAYYKDYKPVFGFVFDVMNNELYWASNDEKHAYCNGNAIHVSDKSIDKSVIDITLGSIYGFRKTFNVDLVPIVDEVRQVRGTHCCTLSSMGVSVGTTQMYLSSRVKVWDYAAAAFILHKAGGYCYIPNFFTTEGTHIIFACSESMLKFGMNLLKIEEK